MADATVPTPPDLSGPDLGIPAAHGREASNQLAWCRAVAYGALDYAAKVPGVDDRDRRLKVMRKALERIAGDFGEGIRAPARRGQAPKSGKTVPCGLPVSSIPAPVGGYMRLPPVPIKLALDIQEAESVYIARRFGVGDRDELRVAVDRMVGSVDTHARYTWTVLEIERMVAPFSEIVSDKIDAMLAEVRVGKVAPGPQGK
jgi:hypothetical protein